MSRTSKMFWPWNPSQRSLKVIGTDTDRSATYDFLLTLCSNYGPISHLFRDKRLFQSKIARFPSQCMLLPRWVGSPWNRVSAHGPNKKFDRYLQPCGYNPPTWQTDRETNKRTHRHADTGRQQRPHYVERRGGKNPLLGRNHDNLLWFTQAVSAVEFQLNFSKYD